MKMIVLSGANIRYGGNLSIYYDCLDELIRDKYKEYKIAAFVSDQSLFKKYKDKIEIIALDKTLKSYLHRIYNEYFFYKRYSKDRDIFLWISLNDFSPRVKAVKQYTYCHNPLPFYNMKVSDIKYSFTTFLMTIFYKYVYRFNRKNVTGFIVQQQWMKNEFINRYKEKENRIVISKPVTNFVEYGSGRNENKIYTFIYPVYPRFFKRIEDICDAAVELVKKKVPDFQIYLTMDGTENKYSDMIYKKYSRYDCIRFIGFKSRSEIVELYQECDCLVFASELETWGMPISEFKMTGKEMVLVNYPYALETLGTYEKVMFYERNNLLQLANCMESMIKHEKKYDGNIERLIDSKCYYNWSGLISYCLE